MMEEEGAVIAGLLVGLNVIDANLCMKGEDLDSQVHFLITKVVYGLNSVTSQSNPYLEHHLVIIGASFIDSVCLVENMFKTMGILIWFADPFI